MRTPGPRVEPSGAVEEAGPAGGDPDLGVEGAPPSTGSPARVGKKTPVPGGLASPLRKGGPAPRGQVGGTLAVRASGSGMVRRAGNGCRARAAGPEALVPAALGAAGMGRGCSRHALPGKGWPSTAQDEASARAVPRTAVGFLPPPVAGGPGALKTCRVATATRAQERADTVRSSKGARGASRCARKGELVPCSTGRKVGSRAVPGESAGKRRNGGACAA